MMLFLSLVGITFFNTLLYIAVLTTTAINTALIQTAMPALIIVITWVGFRERVTRLQSLGIVSCMLGACLVVMRGRFSTLFDLTFVEGDLLMLVAVLLYALYSVFLRRKPPMHALSFLLYTFALGALCLLPLYLWELSYQPACTLNFETVAQASYT